MDQLTRHRLEQKSEEFINSIDRTLVCELASSLHPEQKPCQIFSEPQKGSFNICFPVAFTDNVNPDIESTEGAERWMMRFPILPRLAFPEEKLRGEIATMKYIAEKTTIPIPRLFAYSNNRDNVLALPFMAVEYVTGKVLGHTSIPHLSTELKTHLFQQIAEIYIQLYHQQFDHIGALTLDDNDENWIFKRNRPLSILLNDQELCGMQSSKLIPPHLTFSSTIDYAYSIIGLVFNDFYRGKDSIYNEKDARSYLYSIYQSQGLVMEWVDPDSNYGPFILIHGDLRPTNIFVDDDLNITSVIDWEWSHTVPPQMFMPPSFINGMELLHATKKPWDFVFEFNLFKFQVASTAWENKQHNPEGIIKNFLPLTKFWSRILRPSLGNLKYIAYALLQPCYLGNVYWNMLDSHSHGNDSEEASDKRVIAYFNLESRKEQAEALRMKVSELESYRKELALAGLTPTEQEKGPTYDPDQENNPNTTLNSSEDAATSTAKSEYFMSVVQNWLPCSLMSVSVVLYCIMVKRRQ